MGTIIWRSGTAPLSLGGTLVTDAGTVTLDGAVVLDGCGAVVNLGTIDFGAQSSIQSQIVYAPVGKFDALMAVPLTWTQAGAPTLDIRLASFDNEGALSLEGGTLELRGAQFHNSGAILLTDVATQTLVGVDGVPSVVDGTLTTRVTVAATVTDFVNTGSIAADVVEFDNALSLAGLGAVAGSLVFAGTLDLEGGTLDASAYGSVTISGTVERGVILAGGGQLTLAGATLDDVAVVGAVEAGGTLVAVACFRTGTRIATAFGDMPVEHLRVGERVLTAAGVARPVKWLGRRAYAAARVAANRQLRPVRIAAGALGGGLPRRDLDVSPQHAMLVQGVLVPAGALVNGTTITRVDDDGDVAYVHIELADHDLVLAEGAAAETFVPAAGRAMFDNADEYDELYPCELPSAQPFCRPRLEYGETVERIRRSLGARVVSGGRLRGRVERVADGLVEGWGCAGDAGLEFDLLIDGRPSGRVVANQYRADLDHHGLPACGFRAHVRPGSHVALRRGDGALLAA